MEHSGQVVKVLSLKHSEYGFKENPDMVTIHTAFEKVSHSWFLHVTGSDLL